MPAHDGSLRGHAARAACLCLLLARPAGAQQPPAPQKTPQFFSRYDFHLSAAALGHDDPRFVWTVHFGGDLDLIDYVSGRTAVAVDLETILGDELRAFDPNQSNYTLEASSSIRVRGTEIAAMLHHVSRHLSDRPKVVPIAWNAIGVRVLRQAARGATTVGLEADVARIVQHSFVDYGWIGNASVELRRPLAPHAGVFARGSTHLIGVDRALSSRGRQAGGSVEGGVRLSGSAGAIELFAGYERRVDADPLDFMPERWLFAGFRLVRR